MSVKSDRATLLMNLGSPESPGLHDLRKYLHRFLMDERVIDVPASRFMRALLVKRIIVPLRIVNSSAAYKKIWTADGSPLIVHTKRLCEAVAKSTGLAVEMCMLYSRPAVTVAFETLLRNNPDVREITVLPLYPHYAMSSYEAAVAHVKAVYVQNRYRFNLNVIDPFFNDAGYIQSLATVIEPFTSRSFDHLLFSYHGVPIRHILKRHGEQCHCLDNNKYDGKESPDNKYCYHHQVKTTTRLVAERLKIPTDKYSISFQSRLGSGWLSPYTDRRLKELPAEGVKDLLVVCPAFVSDCLETLEEIGMRGKEQFLKAGGNSFTMIPCLNEHPLWVQSVCGLLERQER